MLIALLPPRVSSNKSFVVGEELWLRETAPEEGKVLGLFVTDDGKELVLVEGDMVAKKLGLFEMNTVVISVAMLG